MTITGTVSGFDSSPAAIFSNVHIGNYKLELYDTTNGYAYIDVNNDTITVDVTS